MNDPAPSCDIVVDVAVESQLWQDFAEAAELAGNAVRATLAHERLSLAPGAEVSLLFCNDAAIRELNRQWRGQDKPTNVLSFPAADEPGAMPLLGDIAIAFETTAREASEEDKPLAAHFCHLVVHGLLHLLGYDHETEAEAEVMEGHERAILAELGIDDPYRLTAIDNA
jgi:probable rRNA maturation factor